MRILVIGGSGLIGKKLVGRLEAAGHEAVPASPSLGVDSVTGAGLSEAMNGADVVVDVTNSPSWEDAAVMSFFETSTRNLLRAGAAAGVRHHVALSVVGTVELAERGDPETTTAGYFRAKLAQERMIAASGIPYSIVHATQFFEFIKSIADASAVDGVVRVPDVVFQPMAADDVAAAVGRTAAGEPVNGIVEIGGPERFKFDEPVRRVLAVTKDPREVVRDADARYFGIPVDEYTLVPRDGAARGEIWLDDWLTQSADAKTAAA